MYVASVEKYTLYFKQPSGTSRGILTEKDSWLIKIWKKGTPEIVGIGEASIIKTLSPEWNADYVNFLENVVQHINDYVGEGLQKLKGHPSVYFAIETALADLQYGGKGVLFPSEFTQKQSPIKINGLIWMGSKSFMLEQIKTKIDAGFDCIKMKIGAIDFASELELLRHIRQHFTADEIELRVDANGAFSVDEAPEKLQQLAAFELHSIEQPIKRGNWEAMHQLCATTPLPIALDEELIGITDPEEKTSLLKTIQPQYIILKPSLVGGFYGTDEWIQLAESLGINWWITSALESNVGLNAIAQYTFTKQNPMPQGLGTGQLYTNNIPSGLIIENGHLKLIS